MCRHIFFNMFISKFIFITIRPLVELCVEPAGLCGRCAGVAVPLRVVPSPTGLPSKRYEEQRHEQSGDTRGGGEGMTHCSAKLHINDLKPRDLGPCDLPIVTSG